MTRRAVVAVALVVSAALTTSACAGGSDATQTVTVTTSAAPVATTTAAATTSAAAKPRTHRARRTSAGRKACDANVTVKVGTTSCAFGENVFYGFWRAQHDGDDSFDAYSPVTERSYAMTCDTSSVVVCRAGDGGEVRFPMAAVDAYDSGQAARYAATHDVGPETTPASGGGDGGDPSQDDSGGSSESNCDPSYSGACLDPDAIDYDCEGGSGDGPEYTGTVDVVGDDHYDLDRDGDRIGCD